ELFARAPSVARSVFWEELSAEARLDWRRLASLLGELRDRALAAPWGAWIAAAVALGLLLFARPPLCAFALAVLSSRAPPGRLRRSARAAGVVLVWTVTVGIAAHALLGVLASGSAPSAALQALLDSVAGILWFGGFCAGLGM